MMMTMTTMMMTMTTMMMEGRINSVPLEVLTLKTMKAITATSDDHNDLTKLWQQIC